MSASFAEIDQLMHLPHEADWRPEGEWHEHAMEVFLGRQLAQPSVRLAAYATDILTSFPYEDAMRDATEALHDKKALVRMRFDRKVLMIGRDALNLCNANRLEDTVATAPLADFTKTLGTIADSKKHRKKLIRRAVQQAPLAEIAAKEIDTSFLNPVSEGKLFERYRQTLHSDILLDHKHRKKLKPKDLHEVRRDFRAASHLGVVSYLVEPDDMKLRYLQQGIELNKHYGKLHTKIRKSRKH